MCMILAAALLLTCPALSSLVQEPAPVDVAVIAGPLDGMAAVFLEEALDRAASEAQALVVQLDSPAALVEMEDLLEKVERSPVPVVVWVGPAPAVARGGAGLLLSAAHVGMAAPAARVGYFKPSVAGAEPEEMEAIALPTGLLEEEISVTGPVPGLIDEVVPTIGQVVVSLDGSTVMTAGGARTLETAEEDPEGGGPRPSVPVRFHEPELGARLLRLALRPEAAFFFMVTGLTLVAFEFYALGPGLATLAGALMLLPAGYGLASLPVRWWSLGLTLAGLTALAIAFQRGGRLLPAAAGMTAVTVGGFTLVDAAPQLVPTWWGVVLSVLFIGLFFLLAMPSVIRARFSTLTIGRQDLVGRWGTALSDLSPDGVVQIGQARWPARSHREAGIRRGHRVRVIAISGTVLKVEPERHTDAC